MKNKQKIILFLFFYFFSFEKIKAEVPKSALKTASQSTEIKKSAREKKSTESQKQNSSHSKALNKNESQKKIKNSVEISKTKPLQPIETKKTVEKEKVSKKEETKQNKSHVSKVSKTEIQTDDVKKPDENNKTEKTNKKKKKIFSKNKKQKKSSFSSQKRTGVRILKIKKGSLFEELGLKKNDIISKINGIFLENSKNFIKHLKKIKKKSSFTITVIRDNKSLILNYTVEKDPVSSKYKYSLKKSSLQEKEEKIKDILEENSHLLQQAYVQHPGGSLVYEKPSFDSKQIYVIPFGEQIVISKKILKPKREIGTFYKIFIKKPQKIAGYISQIEVLPQTVKKENKYVSNPEYDLWKKEVKQNSLMDSQGIFSPSFSEMAEKERERGGEGEKEKEVKSSRFAGVSLGASFESQEKFTDRLQFGLKLSGYDLLVSYINMDINFLFDPNWDNMSIDIMGEYIFLEAGSFKVGPALGLNTNLQFKDQGIRLDLVVALSGLLPLTKNLIWRNDIRFKGFFNKPVNSYFLTALQWGF